MGNSEIIPRHRAATATLAAVLPYRYWRLDMSDHYHDESDLKLLKQMQGLAPDDFKAWLNLNNIVGREEGAIPRKYRELIAIAVACTTQCPYCIEAHAKAAKAAGATREEIVEAAFVAAALRAGGAATHGAMALKFFDQP
jgi:AhpD family alkylhydroperoxidase